MSGPIEYPPQFSLHVQRELRRIGVDLERFPGIVAERGVGPADFLRWLRTIPGGTGHAAFLQRLAADPAAGGPHAPGPDESEAPDVAAYADPEVDEWIAFDRELRRVVPPVTSAGGGGFGFDLPHGRAHGLAVLRALPDGAGLEAFVRALRAVPPPPAQGRRSGFE